jgi:hypothetical protein
MYSPITCADSDVGVFSCLFFGYVTEDINILAEYADIWRIKFYEWKEHFGMMRVAG